jgi:hypothetical protein
MVTVPDEIVWETLADPVNVAYAPRAAMPTASNSSAAERASFRRLESEVRCRTIWIAS